MDKFVLGKFKKIYYRGTILIVMLSALSFSVPSLLFQFREHERKTEQLARSIIAQKKTYIESVIGEKFSDIEEWEQTLIEYEEAKLEILFKQITHQVEAHLDNRETLELPSLLSDWEQGSYALSLKDLNTGDLWHGETGQALESDTLYRETVTANNYLLYMSLPESQLVEKIKEKILEGIRRTELPENEYIWINKVYDYRGGDDYAIRLLHPNLPHTEGALLSTMTEDIKGNRPYQAELEGINRAGEVFNEYYFKEKTSDRISHKLSYARLYEKFDWIIATGIYLNDVDDLIVEEKAKMDRIFRNEIILSLSVFFLVLIIALHGIIRFEKFLRRTIAVYVNRLEQMNRKLKEVAYRDTLTNLLNRRAMYDRFKEEIARNKRKEIPFSIIILDIDHFKSVNDRYGHNAGDSVLKGLSLILEKNVRELDSIARWGGEEFLILLNSAVLDQAGVRAEKLRGIIEDTPLTTNEAEIGITATMGVAEYKPGETPEETIKRADTNLYKGKKAGRNRIVI